MEKVGAAIQALDGMVFKRQFWFFLEKARQ